MAEEGFGLCFATVGAKHGTAEGGFSLRSAPVGAKRRSPGPPVVFAPLRSAQNQRPPDVVGSSLRYGPR